MRTLIAVACILCAPLRPAAAQEQEATPDIPSLMTTANTAYMKGDYEAARQAFAKAWELAQQKDPADPVRYDVLRRLTSVRIAAGEFADADNYLKMAISWRENTLGPNDPSIADDLIVSSALCRAMKQYDRGRAILGRVIALHRIGGKPENPFIADDFSRVAQMYLDEKNAEAAIGNLTAALDIRTRAVGPLDRSIVPDLDRLAGAYVVQRMYDKAEETYRHALVIRETLYGKEDADLIATVDGLAYALFGQKKFDEAEPVYRRLIALWVKSVGEDHPMVAMALDKVATFYAAQKKYDQAKDASDRAIAIRTLFLAGGLSAQATEQVAEGNKEAAIALWRRAVAVMDPPNPLYDESRQMMEENLKAFESLVPKTQAKKMPPKKK